MTKRLEFIVSIDKPRGATVGDVKSYVENAVASWCGQFRPPGAHGEDDPGDPLWGVGKTVEVKRLTERELDKDDFVCVSLAGLEDE